jgi:hypothetical protein
MHTNIHTCIQTCIHACIAHTCTRAYINTYLHVCIYTCICNKALALPYTIHHLSVHTASYNIYHKSYECAHSALYTIYHKSYECAHNIIHNVKYYASYNIIPYIIRARTEREATAGAGDCKQYERNERYDRVRASDILPPLDASLSITIHMYRVLLHWMVRCSIRDQTSYIRSDGPLSYG